MAQGARDQMLYNPLKSYYSYVQANDILIQPAPFLYIYGNRDNNYRNPVGAQDLDEKDEVGEAEFHEDQKDKY